MERRFHDAPPSGEAAALSVRENPKAILFALTMAIIVGGIPSIVLWHAALNAPSQGQGQYRSGKIQENPGDQNWRSGAPAPLRQQTHPTEVSDNTPNGHKDDNDSPYEVYQPLVMIGAITAIIYAFQAFLMWRAIIHSNRAYVHTSTINIDRFVDQHGTSRWRIEPVWENTGNTPTRDMTNYISFEPMTPEMPITFDFPDIVTDVQGRPAKMLIGPKHIRYGQAQIIEPDHALASRLGALKIYLWGWADYKDVFKMTGRHRTEFCYEIAVEGGFIPRTSKYAQSLCGSIMQQIRTAFVNPGSVHRKERAHQ